MQLLLPFVAVILTCLYQPCTWALSLISSSSCVWREEMSQSTKLNLINCSHQEHSFLAPINLDRSLYPTILKWHMHRQLADCIIYDRSDAGRSKLQKKDFGELYGVI